MSFNKKGFTIIELLIVIVVIGILVAFLLPNLFRLLAQARDDERKSDLRSIQSALEDYYKDNQEYPATLGTTITHPTGTTVYLAEVPTDPRDDAAYTYTPDASQQTYTLTADVENDDDPDDAADGTDDGNYTLDSVNQ